MKQVVTVQEAIAGISFAYLLMKAGNHSVMDTCDQAPLGLPKMQDHALLTLHWRSFSGWGRECLSICLLYKGCQYIRKWQCSTILNILQLTVGCLNAAIKRQTRNAEPEIGPNGSSQTLRNPWVDRYGARFGAARSCGSGFWTVLEPNRSVFPVQTLTAGGLPGPVANTSRADRYYRFHCSQNLGCWLYDPVAFLYTFHPVFSTPTFSW